MVDFKFLDILEKVVRSFRLSQEFLFFTIDFFYIDALFFCSDRQKCHWKRKTYATTKRDSIRRDLKRTSRSTFGESIDYCHCRKKKKKLLRREERKRAERAFATDIREPRVRRFFPCNNSETPDINCVYKQRAERLPVIANYFTSHRQLFTSGDAVHANTCYTCLFFSRLPTAECVFPRSASFIYYIILVVRANFENV